MSTTVSMGPSGGHDAGSAPWVSTTYDKITRIYIQQHSGEGVIIWMRVEGTHSQGRHIDEYLGGTFNNDSESERKDITLESDEYIKAIEGNYGGLVNYLKVISSKNQLCENGSIRSSSPSFSYTAPEGFEICGFFGKKSSNRMESIGVVIRKR